MAFKKGNKNGNRFSATNQPKGRGRKKNPIKAWCEKSGIEPMTKEQVDYVYTALGQMTEKELKAIAADEKKPVFLRNAAEMVANKRCGFNIMERMFDRTFGRPKQEVDAQVEAQVDQTNTNAEVQLTPEQHKQAFSKVLNAIGLQAEDLK